MKIERLIYSSLLLGMLSVAGCHSAPIESQPSIKTVSKTSTSTAITNRADQMTKAFKLKGLAVIIRRKGETLLEYTTGNYSLDTNVPIASATKWVTAALVMTVVEKEGFDLDAPLATLLENVPEDKAGLTTRQLLSHTSGLPGNHALSSSLSQPMGEAVDKLLSSKLVAPPGEKVIYGGVSMQIGGYAASKRAGKGWQQLFEERIKTPLGWQDVVWSHPIRGSSGKAANPNLGAGLRLSAHDYISFLEMIASGGIYNGTRILTEESVSTILTDNTKNASKDKLPAAADPSWGYGLGCWCEDVSEQGACLVANSAGAFGTYPWFDAKTGTYGVVVVQSRLPLIISDLRVIQELANDL